MEISIYIPTTTLNYIDCFRGLAALTDSALNHIENKIDWNSTRERSDLLSRVAESVETIASLRGDSSIFDDARSEGLSEYQKEMYSIEYQLRARLLSLGYAYPVR